MLYIFLSAIILIFDQTTKALALKFLDPGRSVTVFNGFFYLTLCKNEGAAWSIFQNGRNFFIAFTFLSSIVLIYFIIREKDSIVKSALSMILGGAIGNLTDRIFRGGVIDFLDFRFGIYNYPVFNIADSFIVIGVFVLACWLIFVHQSQKRSCGN